MANTFIPELSAIRRQDKGLGTDDELILTDDDWVVYWINGYASHQGRIQGGRPPYFWQCQFYFFTLYTMSEKMFLNLNLDFIVAEIR